MLTLADMAKHEAMGRSEFHADAEWKTAALEAVRLAALHLPKFTTNQVWPMIDKDTHDGRAMGAIMQRAAKQGYIVATNIWLPSDSVTNHARPQRVWRSQIWTGAIQPYLLEV